MRKIIIICLSILLFAGAAFAEGSGMEAAGMKISVFIPESLYKYEDGSVALTSGLSTTIGLGDFLELPIGFDYCKFHGYMIDGVMLDGTEITVSKPWFIADNFLSYVKLQFKLVLGPVELKAFGGGALSWNATLTPLEGWAADDIAAAEQYVAFTDFSAKAPFGYGWLTGSSFGLKIDKVTVNIFGEYRDIYNPLTLNAAYLTGPSTGLTTAKTLEADSAFLIMRGIACGIGGSFAF